MFMFPLVNLFGTSILQKYVFLLRCVICSQIERESVDMMSLLWSVPRPPFDSSGERDLSADLFRFSGTRRRRA
jgi:hypothetical protein